MKTSFEIENLKCSGCASTITKALHSFPDLKEPHVDVETETISFEYPQGLSIQPIKDKLTHLGYPEKGSLTGLKKMGANAMSYVSCAIGKLTTDEEPTA